MLTSYADLWERVGHAVPDRTAIIAGPERMTYAEFEDQASRLASLLSQKGLKPGETFAFFLYNRAEYLVAFYAALKIGAVPVSINFRYQTSELAELLTDCDAQALIYPASLAETVGGLAEPRPGLLLEVEDADPSAVVPDAVRYSRWRDYSPVESTHSGAGTLLVYTGGTTGRPKAVVWDEPDLMQGQMYSTYGALNIATPSTPEEVVSIAVDQEDQLTVVLPLAPFIHATALFNSMNVLLLGGTVVVMPSARFQPEEAVKAIYDHRVTRLIVAGDAVCLPLLEAWESSGRGPSPTLNSAVSSGMRLSDDTKARLHALGEVTILDMLASTEGGPYAVATSRSSADLPAPLHLLPGAVVLDAEMQQVQDQPGQYGTLAFRGVLPRGYLGDPEKTASSYPVIDGVRHVMPGDQVRVNNDGMIELLGRGSAVVNTGGEKVYPAEVEEALLAHPAVEDAVVFGIPDARWGEVVAAVVALKEPEHSQVEPAELIQFVGTQLAGYKKPRRLAIRDSLHRSPTGKIALSTARQQLLEDSAENEG